jgi:cyclophilin family peptidyl-prolyl cis-trans isomerase
MKKTIQTLFLTLTLFATLTSTVFADPVKVLVKTSMGEITLALDQEKAPKSVENFLQYARDGFYNGTIFHRVIKGFMVQGGGYTSDIKRKTTSEPIQNEAKNGLRNKRGSIAMARTAAPHSATAQFFINLKDNTFLDHPSQDEWGYAVFGQVIEGMDVVDNIAQQPTGVQSGMRDVPKETVTIEKVTIIE